MPELQLTDDDIYNLRVALASVFIQGPKPSQDRVDYIDRLIKKVSEDPRAEVVRMSETQKTLMKLLVWMDEEEQRRAA